MCIYHSVANKCKLEHEPEYFAATVRHSNSLLNQVQMAYKTSRNISQTMTSSVSALTSSKKSALLPQHMVFIYLESFAFPPCQTLLVQLTFTSASLLAAATSPLSFIASTPRSVRIQVAERHTELCSQRTMNSSGLILRGGN